MDLVFSLGHPSLAQKRLGPVMEFRIDGESLRDHRDSPVLATYVEHQWTIDGTAYHRLDCTATIVVRFEGARIPPSQRFGPFARFAVLRGLAYTDGKAFALFDRKVGAWLCYDAGQHWPLMVVAKAPQASR